MIDILFPKLVAMGIRLFLRACLNTAFLKGRPFAIAVRT